MSFLNPEFRRNLWLELTPARLGVSVLAVVSLLALAAARDSGPEGLNYAAEALFGIVVFLWGGRLAADSVVQEISDRTWDNQRMSALGPWAMSWGKLFGAPICAWAASVPALAAMVLSASSPGAGIRQAATYVLLGVLCHAIALTLSLQSVRKGRQPGRMKTLFFQLVGLAAIWPFAYLLIWSEQWLGQTSLYWFSFGFSAQGFALVSALMFAGWAVLAVYRQMRLELQMPTAPTAWLAFLLFLLAYQTGLIFGGTRGLERALEDLANASFIDTQPLSATLLLAGILLSAMVYVAIFTEPKSMIGLRQAWDAWRRGDWRAVWLYMPRWAVTLKLTAIALVLILAFVELPAAAQADDAEIYRMAVAAFLFLVRNVGIVLLCNFMARGGRGDMAAFIVLAVLSLIAPLIVGDGSVFAAALFWPPINGSWVQTLIPVLAQLVLVGGLLARVWMQAENQRNKPV